MVTCHVFSGFEDDDEDVEDDDESDEDEDDENSDTEESDNNKASQQVQLNLDFTKERPFSKYAHIFIFPSSRSSTRNLWS